MVYFIHFINTSYMFYVVILVVALNWIQAIHAELPLISKWK